MISISKHWNRITGFKAAWAFFLPVVLSGCASLPGAKYARISVTTTSPFVIHESRESIGWGKGTHIYMTPLSDDRIAMTYWVAGDGTTQGVAPISWPLYSDDGGGTWKSGDPFTWETEPEVEFPLHVEAGSRFAHFNKGLFFARAELPNGTRVMFTRPLITRRWDYVMRTRSRDGGRVWSAPEEVTIHFSEDWDPGEARMTFLEGPAAVTSDGRMLVAAASRPVAGNRVYHSYLFESVDEGRTLTYVSTIATPEHAAWVKSRSIERFNGPSEPALLALSDDELICVMRTGVAYGGTMSGKAAATPMLLARSLDGGQTWTHKRLRMPGVMPKLRRLSNGVIVLATGRPGNRLYFSYDNGHSWGRELNLSRPDMRTTGYCDIVEVEPGRLLAAYDVINSSLQRFWLWEPRRVNGVMGQYIDVSLRF